MCKVYTSCWVGCCLTRWLRPQGRMYTPLEHELMFTLHFPQLLYDMPHLACCVPAAMLAPGTLVHDRYTIQEALGAGSNAITYRALDNTTNKPVRRCLAAASIAAVPTAAAAGGMAAAPSTLTASAGAAAGVMAMVAPWQQYAAWMLWQPPLQRQHQQRPPRQRQGPMLRLLHLYQHLASATTAPALRWQQPLAALPDTLLSSTHQMRVALKRAVPGSVA